MEHYREEVAGWREQHAACDAMGKEWNTFKYPAPEIPPVPVATPTDEQLRKLFFDAGWVGGVSKYSYRNSRTRKPNARNYV